MKINIPAEAFHKAALKKRGNQSGEAEGSRKRPRSRTPPAPQAASRRPTPTPPPRRSPTPLPPPRSPTPIPPPDVTVQVPDAPPAEPGASSNQPTDALCLPTTGPSPRDAPEASGSARADKRHKTVARHEARRTASEPTRDTVGPILPTLPSIMNHHHIAEKFLSAASSPAIREELRHTNSRVLYREGQSALLRVVNTFNHALAHIAGGERQVDRLRREALECRERATHAEDALKFAQAGEAERLAIVRSQARAETAAAQQQMRQVLERALAAEGKIMAADAELAEVKAQLEAAKSEMKSSEEKVEIAEEVARLADIKAAEAVAAAEAADKRSAEAASKAVESYRRSSTFVEEVAEAGADAYLHGFYCCRAKAVRLSGVEGLKGLEPEEGDFGEKEVEEDPASVDHAAPPPDSAPTM